MEQILKEELEERILILHRLQALLKMQKSKFEEYLQILERQESAIAVEDMETLAACTEMENHFISRIENLQKVIVPISAMCSDIKKSNETSTFIEDIQKELDSLHTKVLAQNSKNQELLKIHLIQIQKQLERFVNPYRNLKSVYSHKNAENHLIEVEA